MAILLNFLGCNGPVRVPLEEFERAVLRLEWKCPRCGMLNHSIIGSVS